MGASYRLKIAPLAKSETSKIKGNKTQQTLHWTTRFEPCVYNAHSSGKKVHCSHKETCATTKHVQMFLTYPSILDRDRSEG